MKGGMPMFGQMIEALWAGFKIGIQAFLSVLPLYNQLSGLKTEIIAAAIGIPAVVLTIAGIAWKIVKFIGKHS